MRAGTEMQRKCFYRACSCARSTVRSSTVSEQWNVVSGQPRNFQSSLALSSNSPQRAFVHSVPISLLCQSSEYQFVCFISVYLIHPQVKVPLLRCVTQGSTKY